MPRIVFEKWEDLVSWLKDVDPSKYVLYITDNEMIARPVVDPKGRDFGYVKTATLPAMEILEKELKCKIYRIKSYDWKIDMIVREEE